MEEAGVAEKEIAPTTTLIPNYRDAESPPTKIDSPKRGTMYINGCE